MEKNTKDSLDSLRKMITASRMYFEENMTQEEISEKLKVSVPQVSRLISRAKRDGYIKIQVIDPFQSSDGLRERLLRRYPLKDARIVKTSAGGARLTEETVARAAAYCLTDILKANDMVGVAYSKMVALIPGQMPHQHVDNVLFVQMSGIVPDQARGVQTDMVRAMAARVDGLSCFLPLPAFTADAYVRDSLHKDPIVARVLEYARRACVALYSAGTPDSLSPLVASGYLTEPMMREIRARGAVGELFGHFIDQHGELCAPALEARTPGLTLETLREKEHAILVAADTALAPAARAAMLGGYCNLLIVDARTAEALLM